MAVVAMRLILFKLCLLWTLLPGLAQAEWPEFPFPDNARVATLGDNLRVNGVPMRYYGMQFQRSYEWVKEYYRIELERMAGREPIVVPAEGGGIAYFVKDGRYHYSVHLSPQTLNSSMGSVSISDSELIHHQAYEFEFPMDTEVLSDIESNDSGKYSRHFSLKSSLDYQFFQEEMLRILVDAKYYPDVGLYKKSESGEVFYFSGPKREARLTISRDQGVVVAELILMHNP